MNKILQFLFIILKQSGIRTSTKLVCIVCGVDTGYYKWPGFAKELPITACIECGAKNDARAWWDHRHFKSKKYFIGDLSGLNQNERERFIKAFNAECERLCWHPKEIEKIKEVFPEAEDPQKEIGY